MLSRSNFRSYIFLQHNKQPLVDDRTSQQVIEQVRQLECDSHLASVAKVLPSRDGLLKILNSNRDIKIVTTLAMDTKLLSVHGRTSLLPGMGNISEGIFPGQSKWRFRDDEAYLFTCKHPEQVDQNVHLNPYVETEFTASLPPASASFITSVTSIF